MRGVFGVEEQAPEEQAPEEQGPEVAGVQLEASSAREAAFAASLRGALRKARARLIPLLAVCYLVAFMDRANISFAAETMNRDLGFTPKQYGLGAGLFFLSYALCGIPANRMLLRIGARRWLSALLLVWGLVAACMVFAHSAGSFFTVRLLLGAAEAGFFPGALFYLSRWFPNSERARSISFFYVAFPLSSTVMGVVAGGLLRLNGVLGLRGWQWLFLVEALPAIGLSAVVWRRLPDGPEDAVWLTVDERRALREAVSGMGSERLRTAGPGGTGGSGPVGTGSGGTGSGGVDGVGRAGEVSGLGEALRSGRAWILSAVLFLTLGSYYAVMFSLPAMLRGLLGCSQGVAGGLVAIFGVAGALGMLGVARGSDRRRERRWHIAVPTLLMAVSLLAAGWHFTGWFAAAALLVAMTSYYAMQGPLMGLPSLMLRGDAAAVAIAMLTMGGVAGGFAGPYWMGWMRERTGGYAGGIELLALPCLAAVGCTFWMMRGMVPEER